jgi:DNA-binding Xre family transcriptional regulator
MADRDGEGRCQACGAAVSTAGSPVPPSVAAPDRPERATRWIAAVDGQRLRQVRRQRGLSIEKLADQAGLSLATVGRLERDPHPRCRGRTLARLCAALGEAPASFTRVAPGSGGTSG